jgi:peptide-methionine (S)-S-oxide reductase
MRLTRTLLAMGGLLFALAFTAAQAEDADTAVAVFAGGCFWCMEPPFDKLDGVKSTISGYIGGEKHKPTYRQVSAGTTGHTEAVEVRYDPRKVSYQTLLDIFWVNIDPLVRDRQFCDVGSQYRTGIFYTDEQQRELARASRDVIVDSKRFGSQAIVTEISAASEFYPAEDYHQNYYKKNPVRYKYYRYGCGRDKRLDELWGEDRAG